MPQEKKQLIGTVIKNDGLVLTVKSHEGYLFKLKATGDVFYGGSREKMLIEGSPFIPTEISQIKEGQYVHVERLEKNSQDGEDKIVIFIWD